MNKFLKSKKKDEGASSPTTTAPPSSKKLFGRNKKIEPTPEPRPELDLSLPAGDDFRTSLIMPNLSARFSMLRDQDDPRSLIGKASDDSVLAPKRRSRLGLAEYSGSALGDIAEIESIRSSFRPPFAADSRTLSFQSTDTDDSNPGSIMGRARPGEGNVLFGGRQKIYKIPVGDAGAVASLGKNEQRGMRGRALYEDDVQLSSFQRYREQARLAERERKLADFERESHEEPAKDSLNSPALSSYDEKRATTSSTNSGPSMASTTATSVASQPTTTAMSPTLYSPTGTGLQRSNSRRLYDQTLDQHLTEQQNEKLTRLNSLSRNGSSGGRPKLNQSRSATNLRERYDVGSNGSSGAASPLVSASESFDNARTGKSGESSPSGQFNFGFTNTPENPLAHAVDKHDRGKATALGQFNRPKQFDENAFLERQRSLHQQRNTSRPRRPTNSQSPHPDSSATSPAPSGHTSADQSRRTSDESRAVGSARPSVDHRTASARPSVDQRAYPGRPSVEQRGGSSRPSIDQRAGSGRPSVDQRGGSGRPSVDQRAESGRPSIDQRGGSDRPSVDHRGSGRPSTEQRPRAGTMRGESPYAASRKRSGTIQSDRSFQLANRGPPGFHQTSEAMEMHSNTHSQSPRKQPPAPLHRNGFQQPTLPNLESSRGNEERLSPIADEMPGKLSFERGTEDDAPAPLHTNSPPPLQDHPAIRLSVAERPSAEKRRGWSPEDLRGKFNYNGEALESKMDIPAIDVDESAAQESANSTSDPNLKLGGFVRAHLRQISNVSSVYDMEESREIMVPDHTRSTSILFTPATNPWQDKESLEPVTENQSMDAVVAGTPTASDLPPLAQATVAHQPIHPESSGFEQRARLAPLPTTEPVMTSPPEQPRTEFDPEHLKASDAAQWIADLKKQHTRGPSSETEYERRAFAEDLRHRQKTIQENLRIKTENSERGNPSLANGNKGHAHESTFKSLMRKPSSKDSMRRESGKYRSAGQHQSGSEGPHGSPQKPPVGRTLHMKMTGDDDSIEIIGPDASRFRPGSTATHSTPSDSGRPSTSPDESSTTRSSSVSALSARTAEEEKTASIDVHRREFPSAMPSRHATARPSVDTSVRGRSNSVTSTHPPVPPLPINTTVPPLPRAATFESPQTGTSNATPGGSLKGTPTLSATSSVSDMRSAHVHSPLSGSQSASRSASPAVPAGTSFNFPVRTPSERPGAMAASNLYRNRTPSIKKSDISGPTLISSTSTFETMELAEKRAVLKGRGKVATAAAEINATSAAEGETWAVTNAAGQPPSVPPMSPMRGQGYFQRRAPEPNISGLPRNEGGEHDHSNPHGGMF